MCYTSRTVVVFSLVSPSLSMYIFIYICMYDTMNVSDIYIMFMCKNEQETELDDCLFEFLFKKKNHLSLFLFLFWKRIITITSNDSTLF